MFFVHICNNNKTFNQIKIQSGTCLCDSVIVYKKASIYHVSTMYFTLWHWSIIVWYVLIFLTIKVLVRCMVAQILNHIIDIWDQWYCCEAELKIIVMLWSITLCKEAKPMKEMLQLLLVCICIYIYIHSLLCCISF